MVPLPRTFRIIFLSWLTIIGLVACVGDRSNSVVVQFEMDRGDAGNAIGEVRDLRFYVHDVELLDASGQAYPLALTALAPWQSADLALIDLVGQQQTNLNTALRGRAQGEQFSGIRFKVGVPFTLNHVNLVTAAPPLDRGDLFWSWQTGYKFLRADLTDANREWSFHLGSTGCVSASAVRAPDQPCSRPNLIRVELRGFDPTKEPIRVRIDELFKSMSTLQSSVCTGDYEYDRGCADVISKTGLQASNGECMNDCRGQRLFTVHVSSATHQ